MVGEDVLRLKKWDGVFKKSQVKLPSSKSIANRALIIQAIAQGVEITNLSSSKDSQTLQELIDSKGSILDVGPAGTPYRFLTSLVASTPGWNAELTGSERMLERPVGELVEALRGLGADIEYLGEEGCPPLKIRGKALEGGEVRMQARTSSQFVSSLLLVAPEFSKGLTIVFEEEPISKPYIEMTVQTMIQFGAEVEWESNSRLRVSPKPYSAGVIAVESCWSSISYILGLIALGKPNQVLEFEHFFAESSQGDAAQIKEWKRLGLQFEFGENNSLKVWKEELEGDKWGDINCENIPDLAQTFIAYACFGNKKVALSGLKTLRIKETDRIDAMAQELLKCGYHVGTGAEHLEFQGGKSEVTTMPRIATYHDHRVAMAMALGVAVLPEIEIENPNVVVKSFPHFWEELEAVLY